jgi:hypothetical protein
MGVPAISSKYVASIVPSTTDGETVITFDVTATGISQLTGANVLTLVPTIGNAKLVAGAAGSIDWACFSAAGGTKNGVTPTTAGTVLARYVPASCR